MLSSITRAAALALCLPLAASAEPAPERWPLWLEPAAVAPGDGEAAFPGEAELRSLARERAWLERWTAVPPSIAWNDVALSLVVKYQQHPLRATRAFAYLHVTMHDALALCARHGCPPGAWPIAMDAAASRMLEQLYPDETRGRLQALGLSAASAALAAGAPREQAALAWRIGRAVAGAAIRRALYDGWDLPRLSTERPAWKPGVWRASPPLDIYDPLEPNAVRWRTWVLKDSGEIQPPPPPAYGTEEYRKDLEEVLAVHAALTAEQKRIADYWNLDAGSVTPPGVWNLRARELLLARHADAVQAARVLATLNVAMADAMIACWHSKYRWWRERPVTVIRSTLDKDFMPYLVTPAFPAYTSGHASASGAAAEALSAFFPADAGKLHAMAEEAAMSRLYGGIHFRTDDDEGLELGRRVGRRAVARALEGESAQSAATTR